MTVDDVRQRIGAIQAAQWRPGHWDHEAAHGLEDGLHVEVLKHVAEQSSDVAARALAAEALKTLDLDFERWCA